MRPETRLQLDVCEWLRDEHPEIPFHSDLSAGMALSIGQAVMNKRLQWNKAMPDIYLFVAIGPWHGLNLELKADTSVQIRKDGTMGNEKHIVEQRIVHGEFLKKGYYTCFSIGLEQTKKIVSDYLNGRIKDAQSYHPQG